MPFSPIVWSYFQAVGIFFILVCNLSLSFSRERRFLRLILTDCDFQNQKTEIGGLQKWQKFISKTSKAKELR
jgi:hypothetical protein